MVEGLILALVFLSLWGGHWMPWQVIPFLVDDTGKLHRPLAYGYGCGCILVGFTLWAAWNAPIVGVWQAVCFLCAVIAAAGMGTMLPRIVCWMWEFHRLRGDVREYEQADERRAG